MKSCSKTPLNTEKQSEGNRNELFHSESVKFVSAHLISFHGNRVTELI